jgi:hypothetical protein
MVAAVVSAIAATLASWSVYRATRSSGRGTVDVGQLSRVVRDIHAPEHDLEALREGAAEIGASLASRFGAALLALPPAQRPTPTDAHAIARLAAETIIACRTFTPEQYAELLRARGREPPTRLTDPAKADRYWRSHTAWARHEPIDPAGASARARWIGGREVPLALGAAGGGPIRELRGGGFLTTAPGRHTAYEALLPMTVPTISGEPIEAVIGVIIVNDAPDGTWDVGGFTSVAQGAPQNTIVVLPPP